MNCRKQLESEEHRLEMTPMIDVTFLLLVFFLCTLKFQTLEGKLSAYLPKDVGSAPADQNPTPLDLSIRVLEQGRRLAPDGHKAWSGKGPFRFSSERRLQFQVGPHIASDLDAVERRLEGLHRLQPERSLVLIPRPGTIHSDVMSVLDCTIHSGFREIAFSAR